MVKITNSTLQVTSQPRLSGLRQIGTSSVEFYCASPLNAIGTVTLAADKPTVDPGWTVGFLQAEVRETNYAIYLGTLDEDGSMFEDRIGGSQKIAPCFDARRTGTPFIRREIEQVPGLAGAKSTLTSTLAVPAVIPPAGVTLTLGQFDAPSTVYLKQRQNRLTKQTCFIDEVCVQFDFVTVLVAREPSGRFQYLRGFNWSLRWHQKVLWSAKGLSGRPIPGSNQSTVGPVFEGSPTDPVALSVFDGPRSLTCNMLGDRAQNLPLLREYAGRPSYTPHP